MVKFRTKLDEHKHYYCTAGSRYENVYEEELEKKSGKKHLVKTGQTCIYDIIQADLEQSKIENIIHKIAMGDLSVFREAKLTYVDAEDYPQTLMDAQNIVIKAKAEFAKFPAEIRNLFNNSPEQYVSEMGTEEFMKKLTPYNNEVKTKREKEKQDEFDRQVKEAATFNKAVNAEMGVNAE